MQCPACSPYAASFLARRAISRLLLPFLLASGLLWTFSPLLYAQGSSTHAQMYRRIQGLRLQVFCRNHLQAISLALAQYVADNDGRFPTFSSPQKLRKMLADYKISGASLICPISNQDYRINQRFSGKKRKDIPNADKTLLMWSSKPLPDGCYMVLTVSGLVQHLNAGEFVRAKK